MLNMKEKLEDTDDRIRSSTYIYQNFQKRKKQEKVMFEEKWLWISQNS